MKFSAVLAIAMAAVVSASCGDNCVCCSKRSVGITNIPRSFFLRQEEIAAEKRAAEAVAVEVNES